MIRRKGKEAETCDKERMKKHDKGILAKIKSVSYTLIPLNELRDLPTRKGLSIIASFYLCLLVFLLYLVVNGYMLHKNDKFLSLEGDQYDGYGQCEYVPRILDGEYIADSNGYWKGDEKFRHSLGLYSLTFSQFKGNNYHYQRLVSRALELFDHLGDSFTNRNQGYNLLVWMAYSDSTVYSGGKHRLSLTGDPKAVFNRKRRKAQFGNANVKCDVVPSLNYDPKTSVVKISYDRQKLISSTSCMSILDPTNMSRFALGNGWGSETDETYTIEIDMSSVITAAAINQGILVSYEIEMIPYSQYYLSHDGVNYTSAMFFYPRFSNMDPLHCVYRTNTSVEIDYDSTFAKEDLFCAIQIDLSLYGFPVFNHAGKNDKEPTPCDCSEEYGTRDFWICNQFQFVSGFVFYDSDVDNIAEFALATYKDKSGQEMNDDAFNATFDVIFNNHSYMDDQEWRERAYDFCRLPGGRNCSIFGLYIGDLENIYTVNGEYLQLPWSSCNNSASISESSKQRIIENPPSPLTEPYFECKKSAFSTITAEFSSAVGIVIPVRLAFIVFLAFVLYVISKYDENQYETHTFKEKQKTLDFFANTLLLIRDGKYDKAKMDGMETLLNLQKDLKTLGDIPKFFEIEMTEADLRDSTFPRSRKYLDSVDNPLTNSFRDHHNSAV